MSTVKDDYRHKFEVGERVKILTKTSGCYDGKTGVVTEKVSANLQPYAEPYIPRFYRVRLDEPVEIGDGQMSQSDIHPFEQVFPENTSLENYWGIRAK